jgi:cytidyltransferase-like protein
MGCDAEWVGSKLGDLRRRGLLKRSGAGFALTARGRRSIRVVLIGGGFEVIHAGHIYTIDQAKKQGDALVAVVARDSTVRRGKGRDPVTTEVERRKLLSSLRQVDAAILGVKGNIYRTLERVKPDVVALGYDQRHSESEIVREAALRGISLKVVRLDTPHPKLKTSRLLNEL